MRKIITALIFLSFFFVPHLANSQTTVLLNENFNGTWGPYGDNPPSGWRIYGGGSESPAVWNGNDWLKAISGGAGNTACARIYYSPRETSDDSLESPAVTFSASASACSLSFWTVYNWDGGSPDEGYIFGSTDGGTTWTTIDHFTADVFYPAGGTKSYDITSWAKGQTVVFSFWYHANYGYFWNVDDVKAWEVVVLNHDAGTTAILSPTGTVGGATSFTVSANVKNFGQNTETFNVTAEIGSFSSVASVSSLGPGTQTTVIFPDQWVPPDSGSYTVKVYTQLAGDENAANDTLTTTVRVLTHDVGVTAILAPPPGGKVSGRPQTIKAKVKNFGTNTEDFNVTAEIGTFSSTALVSSLTPGTEVEVTLPDTWTPDTNGTYNMTFYTQLLTDQKASNDTAKGTVKVWKAYYDILVCVSSNLLNNKDSLAYTQALTSLGKNYDLWNRWGTTGNEELPPDLYQWKTIIFGFSTGTGWSLNDAQIDSVTAWLNSGAPGNQKNLFFDADDIGYGLGRLGATAKDSVFYFQYLRAEYLTEKNPLWIYPVPGECISTGSDSINLTQSYPDVVRPNSSYPGAELVLLHNPAVTTDSAVMLKYDGTNFNVIYLADRFYELDGPANPAPTNSEIRSQILGRALSWFDSPTCKDVGVLAVVAPTGSSGKKPLDLKARVKNFGLDPQTFDLIMEVGAWSDTENVANLAAGAESLITCSSQWTPLSNGNYNIKAYTRMAGDQNVVNDSAYGTVLIFTFGDADGNGTLNVSDVIYIINYLFKGGPEPVPLLSADLDCSGNIRVADAIYLINYLFKGGPLPCQFYGKAATPLKK